MSNPDKPATKEQTLQVAVNLVSDANQEIVSILGYLEDNAKNSGNLTTGETHLLEAALLISVAGIVPLVGMVGGTAFGVAFAGAEVIGAVASINAALALSSGIMTGTIGLMEEFGGLHLNKSDERAFSLVTGMTSGLGGLVGGTIGGLMGASIRTVGGMQGLQFGTTVGTWVELLGQARETIHTIGYDLEATRLSKAVSVTSLVEQATTVPTMKKGTQAVHLTSDNSPQQVKKSEVDNILDPQTHPFSSQSTFDRLLFGAPSHPYWGDSRKEVKDPVNRTRVFKIENEYGPVLPNYAGGSGESVDIDYYSGDEDDAGDPAPPPAVLG
jgi:hypothetical protein